VLTLKLTPQKTSIPSVMNSLCPAWEFSADTHLLKLQRLQNKVLRIISNFLKRKPTHEMHVDFKIPHVYDFITKLSRQQAEVIQNHDKENIRKIEQGKAQHRKYKRFKIWRRRSLRSFECLNCHNIIA